MNAVTIAHVSDLHLPYDPRLRPTQRLSKRQLSVWSWRRRRHWQRPEILEALQADLRQHAPDHIVITGDLVNFSLPEEFQLAARWLESLAPADSISVVPGNHDALVELPHAESLGLWSRWTRADDGWPSVHHRGPVALIGLRSAWPTPPLLASGRLGREQLSRLESILFAEGAAGRVRIVLLHHPPAPGAVSRRKALSDAAGLRAVLARAGAELVLHGHARDARLDSVAGPHDPIPCLCVPSSTALPGRHDEGARWHRLHVTFRGERAHASVLVRRWSVQTSAFVDAADYELCLPRAACS